MRTHQDHHPEYVDGCFGCKVSTIGYDGGHINRLVKDEHGNVIRKYRNGREDVTVTPKSVIRIKAPTATE